MGAPCVMCEAETALYVEPEGERVPVCWECYHRAEVNAVAGAMPPRILRMPGVRHPFASEPVLVPYEPATLTRSAITQQAVLRLLAYTGPLLGAEIADAFGVGWRQARDVVARARSAGYVEQRMVRYGLSRLGVALVERMEGR